MTSTVVYNIVIVIVQLLGIYDSKPIKSEVNLNLFPCKQEGHTPLIEAAAKSHKDVVQVLLNSNADVTCRTLDVR